MSLSSEGEYESEEEENSNSNQIINGMRPSQYQQQVPPEKPHQTTANMLLSQPKLKQRNE